MSGKTPRQAAYEAYRDRMERTVSFAHPLPGWGDLPDGTRAAWEAAAQAAIGATELTHDADLRRERDGQADKMIEMDRTITDYRSALTAMEHERDRLRAKLAAADEGPRMRLGTCPLHVGEVHAQVNSADEWLCLRGLADLAEPNANPDAAITGAGAEWLARELSERGEAT